MFKKEPFSSWTFAGIGLLPQGYQVSKLQLNATSKTLEILLGYMASQMPSISADFSSKSGWLCQEAKTGLWMNFPTGQ